MACRVWLDVECTGLDTTAGHLLEVAVVATESEAPAYVEVAAQSWVIAPPSGWADTLNDYTLEMHTRSGLLADVVEHGVALAEAEAGLLRFLQYFGNPAPGRDPIAGFSAHFDLGWLDVHLPGVRRYFSHRTFDASTLRQLARDLGREDVLPPQDAAHRALADCRQAIATARAVAGLVGTGFVTSG